MKKFIFPVFAAMVLIACNDAASGSAEQKDSVTIAEKQNALKDSANFTTAEWTDSVNQDLGKVKKGQTIEIPYTIKNTGTKPLIISSVEPGCGCTVADKPEKPIMPGSEEKIIAKFDSKNQATGPHSKSIIVRANTSPATDHMLSFKVEVVD